MWHVVAIWVCHPAGALSACLSACPAPPPCQQCHQSDGTCIFPDWPYLGGVLWYSPAGLSGEVSIGPVANKFSVSSSNPPLEDLSALSRQINGPTSVNYTLTDNDIVHGQLIDSFIAGILAALAAALFVEAAKSAVGKAAESGSEEPPRDGPNNTTDGHPVLTGAFVLATLIAIVRRRR